MSRTLLLVAVLFVSAIAVNADPVVLGPGSAEMSIPIGICTWSASPPCSQYFTITNTSLTAYVTAVSFDLDIQTLTVLIAPLTQQELRVPGLIDGLTLWNATTIHTAVTSTPEPVSLLLLSTGLALLARKMRQRKERAE